MTSRRRRLTPAVNMPIRRLRSTLRPQKRRRVRVRPAVRRILRRVGAIVAAAATVATTIVAVRGSWFVEPSFQVAQKQTFIAEQALYDGRYVKGLELLGAQQGFVRLGAVLELEKLALESAYDRAKIVRILSSFVRNQLPLEGCASIGPVASAVPGWNSSLTMLSKRSGSASS